MRITNKISSDNAVYNINLGRQRMDRMNELITSQQQVNRPSDNPVATKKILDLETQIKTNNQYISNIKNGKLWLDMVGTTVESVQKSTMEIKGIAGTAISGMDDPIKKNEILSSLMLYRDQLLDTPNAAVVGDQYVFSGFNSMTQPFPQTTVTATTTLGSNAISNIDTTNMNIGMPITGPGIPDNSFITAITTPGVGGAVTINNSATATAAAASLNFKGTFGGTDDKLNIELNKGLQLNINVTGGSLIRGGTPPGSTGVDIIKTIDTLIADVYNNNQAGVATAVDTLDQANRQIMSVVGDVGMRSARLENALQAQQRNKDVFESIRSDIQEVDMAKAATDLTNLQTAFEASLAATAKITPLSLLDYLR